MKILFDDICKYIPFPYGVVVKGAWKLIPAGQQESFLVKVNEVVDQGVDLEKREVLIQEIVDHLAKQFPAVAPQKHRIQDALRKVVKLAVDQKA